MKPIKNLDDIQEEVLHRINTNQLAVPVFEYGAKIEAYFTDVFNESYNGQKEAFDAAGIKKYEFMKHYQHSIDERRRDGESDYEIWLSLHTQNEMYRFDKVEE